MGEVWKAYDQQTGSLVALKVLHEHLTRGTDLIRFQREIRHLSIVPHENIIRIVDIAPEGAQPAYVMEYCPAGDLTTWSKQVTDPEARRIGFLQICRGVAALHRSSNRIVHRDLKPPNVLWGADGNLKVSDLGLSVSLEGDETRPTRSNWVSRGFSPPEQFRSMLEVTETGDVYSLGAILYYLYTGRDCSSTVVFEHDSIPEHVRPLLKIMLAENPKARFRNAASLTTILGQMLEKQNVYQLYNCPRCGGYGVDWIEIGQFAYECYDCGLRGSEP